MIGLAETWLMDENVNFQGFHCFFKGYNGKKNKGRAPGGLALLIREGLSLAGAKIECTTNESLWIEIEDFDDNGYLVGVIYFSPEASLFYRKKAMTELEQQLLDIAGKYEKIILMGDFNARTGGCQTSTFSPEDENFIENTLFRSSKDAVLNAREEELLKLGSVIDLVILNGTWLGDSSGDYTYSSANGASAVDYILVSGNLIDRVEKFEIGDFEGSDHFPLILTLRCNSPKNNSCDEKNCGTDEPTNIEIRQKRFVWKTERVSDILLKLNDSEIINFMLFCRELLKQGKVEEASGNLGKLLFLVNVYSEVIPNINSSKKSRSQQAQWFDKECRMKRKELRKCLREFRKDIKDKKEYLEIKSQYKLYVERRRESPIKVNGRVD